MATEDKSQVSAIPLKDGKEAQKNLDHLDKNGTPKITTKWTGFQGKALWDWLQLLGVLAIPLVVAGATLLFSIQQANLAQQQHDNDQKIANQQHLQDQALALDQQRQATLVKYQDDMRDLLLHEGLLTSKPGDPIRVIALTETLSAMSQLDAKRISFLIRFLWNAHLNGVVAFFPRKSNFNIVNFSGANLSAIDFTNADLSYADLEGADLSDANLHGAGLHDAELSRADLLDANLSRAELSRADLSRAELIGADLSDANLEEANLFEATLDEANLSRADLSQAYLEGAELQRANLSGAYLYGADLAYAQDLTQQQLDQVSSCKDATLPQGLTCNRNKP